MTTTLPNKYWCHLVMLTILHRHFLHRFLVVRLETKKVIPIGNLRRIEANNITTNMAFFRRNFYYLFKIKVKNQDFNQFSFVGREIKLNFTF